MQNYSCVSECVKVKPAPVMWKVSSLSSCRHTAPPPPPPPSGRLYIRPQMVGECVSASVCVSSAFMGQLQIYWVFCYPVRRSQTVDCLVEWEETHVIQAPTQNYQYAARYWCVSVREVCVCVCVCVEQAVVGYCRVDPEGQTRVGRSSPLITEIMAPTLQDWNVLTAKWSLEDRMEGEEVCVCAWVCVCLLVCVWETERQGQR